MDSNTVPPTSDEEIKLGINKLSNNQLKDIIEKNKKEATNTFLSASLGGGYASCGYHTILHLQTLRDVLKEEAPGTRGAILTKLTSLWEANNKFGLDVVNITINKFNNNNNLKATWRDEIIKQGTASYSSDKEDGEWLTHEGMTNLAEKYLADKNGTYFFPFVDKPTEALGKEKAGEKYIIQAYTKKNVHENYITAYGDEVKSAKNNNREPNIPTNLAFLVNTQGAHWYGIFITVNTYPKLVIIVDSKNAPRYNHYPLKEILTGIFPQVNYQINMGINTYFTQGYLTDEEEQQIAALENLVAVIPIANTSQEAQNIYHNMLLTGADYAGFILMNAPAFEPLRKFFKEQFKDKGGENYLIDLFDRYKTGNATSKDDKKSIEKLQEDANIHFYNLFTLLAEKPSGS